MSRDTRDVLVPFGDSGRGSACGGGVHAGPGKPNAHGDGCNIGFGVVEARSRRSRDPMGPGRVCKGQEVKGGPRGPMGPLWDPIALETD